MNFFCIAMRGRGENNEQQLEPNNTGKTNALTSVSKDNLVIQVNPSLESGGKQPYQQNRIYDSNGISPALCENKSDLIIMTKNYAQFDVSAKGYKSQQDRAFYDTGKHGALATARAGTKEKVLTNSQIRRLTPTECARLQTIPDWYEWIVSDTQIYRMLGNGWTVEVVKYILSYLKC